MLKKYGLLLLTTILLIVPVYQSLGITLAASTSIYDDFTEEELADNDYIIYMVNAGDPSPDTLEGNDKLGLFTSKTDQMYGTDAVTGKKWGLVTETTAPSVRDETNKYGSLRYYNGPQIRDKAIEYKFELPVGEYDVAIGFKNPWSGRSVNILLNDENVSIGDYDIGSYNAEKEFVYRQFSVTNGELTVRIQGPATAELTNHNDPLVNYIIVKKNVIIPITDLEAVIADAQIEADKNDYYTTSSIENLAMAIDVGQELVDSVLIDGVDVRTIQNEIFTTIQNITTAVNQLAVKEDIGIGVMPFVTSENAKFITNAHIQWSEVTDTKVYVLYRSDNPSGKYKEVYRGTATMFGDYDLKKNRTFHYKIRAIEANGRYVESEPIEFKTFKMPKNVGVFHNNEEGGFQGDLGPGGIKYGDTYYSYRQENDGNGFKQINLYTSPDGYNWTFDKVVMDRNSHPDLAASKLESGKVFFNPNTEEVVGWYHYENNKDYTLARAAVASGKPGEEWTFHGSFRPNGNESRDITYFIDDDGTGYIMSASNNNADFTLYELKDNHYEIEREITTLFKGQHREGPGFLKKDDYYYIFTSEAAGWYPSKGGYASAPSMDGPWTELRFTGNNSTFSAQSGYTFEVSGSETTSYFMNAYRWQHGWAEKPGGAGDRWFSISLHNGYAFYDYFEKILIDYQTGYSIGVQHGELLSQGKPAYATDEQEGAEATKANDGNYQTSWVSENATWPKSWTIDLEDIFDLRNIQISWYLHKGSEGTHLYEIETSLDGENFELALDRTDNKNYGFTSDALEGEARYVRINLIDAKLHNNPNNWYTPQLSEVKIFGHELEAPKGNKHKR
nr:family 43 glycosylhydrolase [Paenibacillus bovis]